MTSNSSEDESGQVKHAASMLMKALQDFVNMPGKVSAGNSGHPKTPDTSYISAMDEFFGLKLLVLKHLPLGYIQTKMS